jgi:hypothetical protein
MLGFSSPTEDGESGGLSLALLMPCGRIEKVKEVGVEKVKMTVGRNSSAGPDDFRGKPASQLCHPKRCPGEVDLLEDEGDAGKGG